MVRTTSKSTVKRIPLRKHLSEMGRQLNWGISLEKEALFFYYAIGVLIAIMVQVEDNLPFGFKGELFSETLFSYIIYGPLLVILLMLLVVMLFRFFFVKYYRGHAYRLSRLLVLKLWQLALPAIFVFLGVTTFCLFMWLCFSLPTYKKYVVVFIMYVFFLLIIVFIGQSLCLSKFLCRFDKNFKYFLALLAIVLSPMFITYKGGGKETTIKLNKTTYEKLMHVSDNKPEEYLQKLLAAPQAQSK